MPGSSLSGPMAPAPASYEMPRGRKNQVAGRHQPSSNTRTGGSRPGPQSRALPPGRADLMAEKPLIPAAREETVELIAVQHPLPASPPLPMPPASRTPSTATPPTPTPAEAAASAAPAPEQTWPSRPAPDDAAAEVWALVERAQAGDGAAFGLLYDRYVDTVFRFIYFRVGSRPLAEDLTSDTFLRALKRINSFTWQGRDLGAWLVTIARNLVADHFKSGRYRLEVTTGDVLDADHPDRGPEGSPEVAVVDHITNVALLGAVRQLNPEQQECIVLRFLHGFSVAETAQAMGKNEGAIKALQYRAVRALHRLLPDGFQP
jgi:RNA polymerase sigma-70 factor (ECF subfamily)